VGVALQARLAINSRLDRARAFAGTKARALSVAMYLL